MLQLSLAQTDPPEVIIINSWVFGRKYAFTISWPMCNKVTRAVINQ